MRKLAPPTSLEEISVKKVKSDFSKSYRAEDKAVEKLLGNVAQHCHEETRRGYRKDKKGSPKRKI